MRWSATFGMARVLNTAALLLSANGPHLCAGRRHGWWRCRNRHGRTRRRGRLARRVGRTAVVHAGDHANRRQVLDHTRRALRAYRQRQCDCLRLDPALYRIPLAEAQQTAACNAAHGAGPRLCRWLLQCADRIGRDELPLTQEYLAQMVGVRRTTVTLLAHEMQIRGLLRYRRGHIVLLDRKGLEECACECYDIMRHEKLAPTLGVHFNPAGNRS